MKTPKYTPGPWKADYNCTTLITGIVDGEEVEIAHVDDSDDARLIAAAPELLECLIHLADRDWFKDGYNGRSGTVACSMPAEKVRNALSKVLRQNIPAHPPTVGCGEGSTRQP